MNIEDHIKLFRLSHSQVESDLDKIEGILKVDLQREEKDDRDEDYYPQFDHDLRVEAANMAKHYELFYCLEKNIRSLVADTLKTAHGDAWWTNCVAPDIQQSAQKNQQKEIDSGVTIRSEDEIDYTTFGELGHIVQKNWPDFDAMFSSEKAFSRIMTNLNTLRSPIAHCSPLAEDEVVRLSLTVRDWFRLME
jgi:hypothetical protein